MGFDRKRYRFCSASGVLSLPLIRRGALGHRVEVYVGLDGIEDLKDVEIDLLSPKLVVFEPGDIKHSILAELDHEFSYSSVMFLLLDEVAKQVRVRVTVSREMTLDKQFFTAAVKAPTAAVLDSNSEAHVVIMGKHQSYHYSESVKY